MSTIHLLTWNLNKRELALDMLAQHIASRAIRGEPFIASVQECSDDAASILAKIQGYGASGVHAMGNGTMSVLCSESLADMPPPRDAVGLRLVLTRTIVAGKGLAIVNYHGEAQGLDGSPHITERGGIASEARWRVDDHAAGDPVIVFGDFNAEPTDPEIESLYCFSFAPHPSPGSHRSHNRDRSALTLAPLEVPPALGTWASRLYTRGSGWRTFDFLAAGPNLKVQTRVLTDLDGNPLTDGAKPTVSDHLPVAGILELP